MTSKEFLTLELKALNVVPVKERRTEVTPPDGRKREQ
jgi:hypothetical protein